MTKTGMIILASAFNLTVMAQQKDFEGIITYKTDIKSRSELISERALKNLLGAGSEETVFIKHGNYRQITSKTDSYYIPKDQKAYIKFKGVDTLYYVEYSSDTAEVTNVSKSEEKRNIAGFECKLLTVQLGSDTKKYYYAPALHMNPEYDKNNRIGRYDVFIKETSSLYLGLYEENKTYSLSETCTHLESTQVGDTVFNLPPLPQRKFSLENMIIPAEFNRTGGWAKYLQANLNGQLAAKYIKIPKGEETASQQVIVKFLINEYGKVSNAEVLNKKEVHPRLAEEALRVVSESPLWKPATFLGEKTIFWFKLPITFEVSKQ